MAVTPAVGWALANTSSPEFLRKLRRQPFAEDLDTYLEALPLEHLLAAHTVFHKRLTRDVLQKHIEMQQVYAANKTAALDQWFACRGVSGGAVFKPMYAHPAYNAEVDQCGIGFITDEQLCAHYKGMNLKLMSVEASTKGDVYIRHVRVYWQGPRDATKCVYFFRSGARWCHWIAPYEADVWPVPARVPPKMLAPKIAGREKDTQLEARLLQSGSAVRVLCLNREMREEVFGHVIRPGVTTAGRIAAIVPALSEEWFRGTLFIEYFLWSCFADGCDLNALGLNLSSANAVSRFFGLVRGGEIRDRDQPALVEAMRTKHAEFQALVSADAGRLSALIGANVGNCDKDFASRFCTNLGEHSKLAALKQNFVSALRSCCHKSVKNSHCAEALDGKTASGSLAVRPGCAVTAGRIVVLWKTFFAAAQLHHPQTLVAEEEVEAGASGAQVPSVISRLAKKRRTSKSSATSPKEAEADESKVELWSEGKYVLEVVKCRYQLKQLLESWDLFEYPEHMDNGAYEVTHKDLGAVGPHKRSHSICTTKKRKPKKHQSGSDVDQKKDDQAEAIRRPKNFSLVPHSDIGRTFVRLDRTTLRYWKDNQVFPALARLLHVKYVESEADRVEEGTYIGSSFTTNGHEVHVVVETFANKYVNPAGPDGRRKPLPVPDRPTACSHLVNTRNPADFVATGKGGYRRNGVPGVYCVFDIAATPAAADQVNTLACLGRCTGVDAGKQFPYSSASQSMSGKWEFHRMSQGEYYATVRNRNLPDTDAKFARPCAWRWRKKHGFVPGYVLDAWKGLKSRKPFTFAAFCAALKQLDEPVATKCKKPAGCVTRQQCMWRYALCREVADRRFAAYRRKQQMLDKIVQQLAPHPDSVVFVGNGYDGAQHQGQRTGMHAPIKCIIRHLGRKRRVVMVPEFRTTISCFRCRDQSHVPMEDVFDGRTGARNDGIKYCPQCHACVNRDRNAAQNILAAGMFLTVWRTVPKALQWSRGEVAWFKSDPWRLPVA